MKLGGKSVIITGASTGIGAAAALLFADEGARLTLSPEAPGAKRSRSRRASWAQRPDS